MFLCFLRIPRYIYSMFSYFFVYVYIYMICSDMFPRICIYVYIYYVLMFSLCIYKYICIHDLFLCFPCICIYMYDMLSCVCICIYVICSFICCDVLYYQYDSTNTFLLLYIRYCSLCESRSGSLSYRFRYTVTPCVSVSFRIKID